MSNGLLKTELLCFSLWDGDMKIQLPFMPEGRMFYLHFTMPTKARIEGLFLIEKRLDMYDTREGGYVQRLRIKPYEEENSDEETLDGEKG